MEQRNSKKRSFLVQGSILAMAGILCRIIGMLYRMPLVDVIGTKGNGYYTSAYSIYNILLVASSYSLPTAISKIISERLSEQRPEDARRAMRVAFLYSTFIGALMFAIMFFGAEGIAKFMNKPFLSYVLMTLAPTIWIMAYLGILRGYFQGTDNMMPTAVSQILEQVINAVVSVIMAGILFGYGEKLNQQYSSEEYSYAFGAAGGTIGTGAGALIALLFFLLIYFLYGRKYTAGSNISSVSATDAIAKKSSPVESYGRLWVVLLATLTPILFSALINNINTVADDYIFSNMMGHFGLSASVVLLWGIFGEYRVIFNIPVAISNSFSASIIPSLTKAVALKDRSLIIQKMALGIRFTMIIAIPACLGIAVLAEPVCAFLFPSETTGILVNVLRIGSPSVIFYSLSTITTGILHGTGHYKEPLINAVLGLVIHIVFLVALMLIWPGIYSVMAATVAMGLVTSILNFRSIQKYYKYHQYISKTYLIPFAVSAVMAAAAYLCYRILNSLFFGRILYGRLGTGILLAVSVFIALLVYFTLLFLARPFRPDELIQMPLGSRIYRLAKKFRLMK